MNDSFITMSGNVATEPRHRVTDTGHHLVSFRMASNRRKYTSRDGWVDEPTSYVTVTAWRFLAENVAASIEKGDPIVVAGTLKVRDWSNGDRSGSTAEIDAKFLSHDLNRGVTQFRKVTRTRAVTSEEELELRRLVDEDSASELEQRSLDEPSDFDELGEFDDRVEHAASERVEHAA
jgi:single-strand DNA-binding protein